MEVDHQESHHMCVYGREDWVQLVLHFGSPQSGIWTAVEAWVLGVTGLVKFRRCLFRTWIVLSSSLENGRGGLYHQ